MVCTSAIRKRYAVVLFPKNILTRILKTAKPFSSSVARYVDACEKSDGTLYSKMERYAYVSYLGMPNTTKIKIGKNTRKAYMGFVRSCMPIYPISILVAMPPVKKSSINTSQPYTIGVQLIIESKQSPP